MFPPALYPVHPGLLVLPDVLHFKADLDPVEFVLGTGSTFPSGPDPVFLLSSNVDPKYLVILSNQVRNKPNLDSTHLKNSFRTILL